MPESFSHKITVSDSINDEAMPVHISQEHIFPPLGPAVLIVDCRTDPFTTLSDMCLCGTDPFMTRL